MDRKEHSDDVDEENQAFLPQENGATRQQREDTRTRKAIRWLRIAMELGMAATIVFLLFFRPSDRIIRTPVPKFPRKLYTFHNDPQYTNEDMFFNESATLRTLHNWIPLSSASRGYVVLPDTLRKQSYDLPDPYTVAVTRNSDGPGYMMSVFHQLHCLSYLAEHYQQGYALIPLSEEVAHHSAHCFSYLRQGITCNADTTLEGKTDAGPGEGSVHECVDYDAVLDWANGHSALRWRNGLLPGESVL
ncbi:hypothetical protein EJ04DRAFT_557622 [Polyplosphaeria fusca]|uniref:Oxidase ustYa n=1 Tax=Polyplosphaeria fusca TaxID=682080 RepID=A0A9P4QLR6_9PLEO|nr:hypothetical protein EJ04DRAFT_557622 [Polyplosphaeria fusca]